MALKDLAELIENPDEASLAPVEPSEDDAFDSPMMIMNQIHEA